MKEITVYQCEICDRKYPGKVQAERCEARGVASVDRYPIGTIIQKESYSGYTFAIAEHYLCHDKHLLSTSWWACRPEGNDSLWKEKCSGGFTCDFNGYYKVADFDSASFKRMVDYLKLANIQPYIWDGEKAIPYQP